MERSWLWEERREEGDIGSGVIAKVFRSRTDMRLKNKEKNFEFNAGGEGKAMKLDYISTI